LEFRSYKKNDEYYKDEFICKQEKEIILKMINAIEEYMSKVFKGGKYNGTI